MASFTPPPEPTEEQAHELFQKARAQFPSSTLGHDQWYLIVLAALTYTNPTHAKTLYSYLLNSEETASSFSTVAARQRLMRRLREVLVKCTPLMGICKGLEALLGIISIERDEDQDFTFPRVGWVNDEANRQRGDAWLETIYQQNLPVLFAKLEAHKEFEMLSREITYGLFLSDMSVLGQVETEIVTLAGIAVQDLPTQTLWHLRGCRRIGISPEDVEMVQKCVELVAEFGGMRLWKIPRVKDIEGEV